MPLPLLFIGIAAATGGLGVGKTIKAGIDVNNAKKTNKNANEIVETSTEWLNAQRMVNACRFHENTGRQIVLFHDRIDTVNGTVQRALAVMKNPVRLSHQFLRGQSNRHQAEVCTNINSDGEIFAIIIFHSNPSFLWLLQDVLLNRYDTA